MKRHFQLTLRISADDLMILTTYLEHAYDRAVLGPAVMPRPLAKRLRELASSHPTDTAFQYLVLVASPEWEIREVTHETVTIATCREGASLPRALELLGRLAPSCLEAAIVYEPIAPTQDPEGAALH